MTEQEVCVLADRTLNDVVAKNGCSARNYLIQITYFRGLRAHDIAGVIGVDPTLAADLVQGLWDELSPVADEWRELGAFPPRVDIPGDAPHQDRLLGLTGRDPNAA
jgi:hypothetical protein